MGGDCLNTGCVPSKALLAAAHAAQAIRGAGRLGLRVAEPRDRLGCGARACARRHRGDRADGFRGALPGARRHRAARRRRGSSRPTRWQVDGRRITARRIVIAAGSRAAVPPIPGLDRVPFLTNETPVRPAARPEHLLILGGGPIGLEMADAFAGLGSARHGGGSGDASPAARIRSWRPACDQARCARRGALEGVASRRWNPGRGGTERSRDRNRSRTGIGRIANRGRPEQEQEPRRSVLRRRRLVLADGRRHRRQPSAGRGLAGGRTWRAGSAGRRTFARRPPASSPTAACARSATGGSSRRATSPTRWASGRARSPMSAATTPGSSSAACCSACRRGWTTPHCRGSPTPTRNWRRSG